MFRRKKSQPPSLNARIACFREVLHANNAALGIIATIQEVLAGERTIRAAELTKLCVGITVQTFRMATNLNRMTGGRYEAINRKFDDIVGRIARRIEITPTLKATGYVLPLEALDCSFADVVGQKSAYLGEAMRILKGRVPAGFAITFDAYQVLMARDALGERIAGIISGLDPENVAACFEASARIVQMVENAKVPYDVSRAIDSALSRFPPDTRMAVRSSAMQEGGQAMSFAGQYRSMFNIPPAGVVRAFRDVIASKYSPQAISYRLGRGYDDAEVGMCCCVIEMIPSVAAGVAYSAFPTPSGIRTVVQAVRGLGLSAVDGSAEPDTYLFNRVSRRIMEVRQGMQSTLLLCSEEEGTERRQIDEAARKLPVLEPDRAAEIAECVLKLEAALKMPIDVEWAIGPGKQLYILQVRPLSDVSQTPAGPRGGRVPGASILIERGSRASGGSAHGKVHRVESDLDILRCPRNSVIVTHEANPRFAVLLPCAAAIVADRGEVTGHLATVAREMRVPALFATRNATELLPSGTEVTVDADAAVVYAGRVDEALISRGTSAPDKPRDPNRELLQSVADLIIPLTLRDRLASGYAPKKCQTLHDIIRFCHQATIEAMFDLGDHALGKGQPVHRLVSPVPIDCRVFDLGDGLKPNAPLEDVSIEDVACRPMIRLWTGMTDPRVRWRHERPVSMRGFMSALVNYNFDDDARMRKMGEPSYAFISSDYLNLNSRIGYHFSTIDARICGNFESNYASFRFVGGSTGIDQRSRRALLIKHLLERHNFETDCRADLVNARIRYRSPEDMDEALFYVGLLMAYVNHLDMALVSDEVMRKYEDAFLAGDYGLQGQAFAGEPVP